MSTLQQINAQTRALIAQLDATQTDISDTILNGMINEGLKYLAVLVEYPRDIAYIQVQQAVPAYPLPADFMKLRTAYFGDPTVNNDITPISIMTEEKLKEITPWWLDKTVSTQGQPNSVIILDKKTLLINPTPDAANSAAGKQLIIGYVYYPAVLVNNSDVPDLPTVYHDDLKLYAGYLAFMGILKNPKLAEEQFSLLLKKVKSVQVQANDENQEKFFGWGNYEDTPSSQSRLATLRF